MIASHLKRMYAYNQWANQKLLDHFTEIGGHEKMLALFSHLQNAHAIWNARMLHQSQPVEVWQTRTLMDMLYVEVENHLQSLQIIDEVELDHLFTYENTTGQVFENSYLDTLYHVINHGTHHRAQILQVIRGQKQTPPALDYIFYLRGP